MSVSGAVRPARDGLFVLVKWVGCQMYDVYGIDRVFEENVRQDLVLGGGKALKGDVIALDWQENDEPCPAIFVDIAPRRRDEASKALTEENGRLKRKLEEANSYKKSGVTVPHPVIDTARASADGNASIFALALMRALYPPDELEGHSMYGVLSNAHKIKSVKPPIDQARLNAILSNTAQQYKGSELSRVKQSIRSFLLRV